LKQNNSKKEINLNKINSNINKTDSNIILKTLIIDSSFPHPSNSLSKPPEPQPSNLHISTKTPPNQTNSKPNHLQTSFQT